MRDEDDGRLPVAELLDTAVPLVTAGHETTVNLPGNAVGALIETLDLAWADPATPLAWIPGGIMRGPLSLPVRFTRRG